MMDDETKKKNESDVTALLGFLGCGVFLAAGALGSYFGAWAFFSVLSAAVFLLCIGIVRAIRERNRKARKP